MTVLFFISMFFVTIFSFFSFSIKIVSINRAVVNTPIDIFTTSIPLTEISDNEVFFEKEKIEKDLLSYYHKSLDNHLKDMKISIYYYNRLDGAICISGKCDSVEVTIDGTINYLINYHRVMHYEIRWAHTNG